MSTAAPLAPADLTITEQESVARRAAFGSDSVSYTHLTLPTN